MVSLWLIIIVYIKIICQLIFYFIQINFKIIYLNLFVELYNISEKYIGGKERKSKKARSSISKKCKFLLFVFSLHLKKNMYAFSFRFYFIRRFFWNTNVKDFQTFNIDAVVFNKVNNKQKETNLELFTVEIVKQWNNKYIIRNRALC